MGQRAFLTTVSVAAVMSVISGQLLALTFHMPLPSLAPPFFTLSLILIGIGAATALGCYVVWLALWQREADPLPRVIAMVRRYTSTDYLGRRIAPLVASFFFMSAFNTFKVFIPRIQPFYLDGFLSDLDRWVFGTDPWRISHALIGPSGTRVLDISYGLWFPAWLIGILYFSLFADLRLQRRFFLSFLGTWAIIGICFAIAFSSAGPCFLQLIHHPDAVRYEGLFPLQNAPGAARAQEYLARAYLTGELGLAKGISAMPSVHVAIAAVLVFAARHCGRIAFAAAVVLYALIFVASVHLGWHYVSDGVVGTIGAGILWRLTGLREPSRALESIAQPQLS